MIPLADQPQPADQSLPEMCGSYRER